MEEIEGRGVRQESGGSPLGCISKCGDQDGRG